MRHLVDTPDQKKRSCKKHNYEIKYPQGSATPVQVCSKCCKTKTCRANEPSPNNKKSEKTHSVLANKQSKLPLESIERKVARYKDNTNWNTISWKGFRLPATRNKYSLCGVWMLLGCLDNYLHQLFGKGNRAYIKKFKRSCYRASCESCFVKWITREAERAKKRIMKYCEMHPGLRPMHLMLLIPPSQYDLPYYVLKERMIEILKIGGWRGGAILFHPFKFRGEWYVSPHFHLMGFGSASKLRKAYGKYGWYVKIAEERQTVFGTFTYLLYHCGIREKKHAVIWIGDLSYRKFKVEKEKKITCCTACNAKLRPVKYDGVHPIVSPEKDYCGLVDWDEHWHYE